MCSKIKCHLKSGQLIFKILDFDNMRPLRAKDNDFPQKLKEFNKI